MEILQFRRLTVEVHFMFRVILLLMASFALAGCGGKQEEMTATPSLTISNQTPRLTSTGEIVDAHDGRTIRFGDFYYWYGTAYGNTNGFTPANHYVVYRSRDLTRWEALGPILPDAPEGVYYRPHVVYNAANNRYVLWYNWYPELWDGQFGVAVSDRPEGPFTIVNDDVRVSHSDIGVGDFGLFVDDDAISYLAYNTIEGHRVSVEKLSADYLSSTMENGGFLADHCEAGTMFKRENRYYLLTDFTCCFCTQGSGARVYVSDDPLTGYEYTNNINRHPGERLAGLDDGEIYTTNYTPLQRKDSTTFAGVVLQNDHSAPIAAVHVSFFTGDRRGYCGEVDRPEVHEPIVLPRFSLQYFDRGWRDVPVSEVDTTASALVTGLTYRFPEVETYQIRLSPALDFPYDVLRLTEIEAGDREPWSNARTYRDWGEYGPPIVPAQQNYIMELPTADGPAFIWMGDLWGSASDNVKGHDYQYWSAPLVFDEAGWIMPMRYRERWSLEK